MANYPYSQYGGMNYMPNGLNTMPTNTYQPPVIAPQQPVQELIRVTGIEGAKAYQMAPNSVVPLFDANNDIMYIKSTDGAGFPSIRAFSFAPIEQAAEPAPDYVQRSEFDALVEEVKGLMNAKQPISEPATK